MNTKRMAAGFGLLLVVGAVAVAVVSSIASIRQQQQLLSNQLQVLHNSVAAINTRQQKMQEQSKDDQLLMPLPSTVANLDKESGAIGQSERLDQIQTLVSALAKRVLKFEDRFVTIEENGSGATSQASVTAPLEVKEKEEEISTEAKFNNLAQRVSASGADNPDWVSTMTPILENVLLTDSKYTEIESTNVACGDRLCSVEVVIPGHLDDFRKQELEWHILFDVQKHLPEVTYTYDPISGGGRKLSYFFAEKGLSLSGTD